MKTIKLLTMMLLLLAAAYPGNAQTLHVLIFGDTNCGGKVGESVMNDYNSIIDEIGKIQTATGLTLNSAYYNDYLCTKETLLEALKDLKCQPSDVVIFYYSGHGGRAVEDTSVFPQLTFDNYDSETYPLYKIDEQIASKHPAFRLVIADCCNSEVPGMTVKSLLSKGKSILGKGNTDIYKKLFLNVKGRVVVASSKAGQTSGICEMDGMLRGTFTVCLENELEKLQAGNSDANWNALLENVKIATRNTSGNSVSNQTPVFEVNLDGASTPSSITAITPTTNDPFIATLIKMADNGANLKERLDMVDPTLEQWFGSNAIVEVFGRSGLRLKRETAKDFLQRISIEHKLTNFAELERKSNSNGKITYLKLHEIYRQ
ncbi:MAG: caspase family protein [Bacteroidales bacterium]|nr:caspase family protein [Bacteroidales bacterium]